MKANAVELVKSLGNTVAEWRQVRGAGLSLCLTALG